MWEYEIIEYQNHLKLERSLSNNSIEAYLNDIKKLTDFLKSRGHDSLKYSEVDIDVIERIMKRQEYLIKENPKGDYRILCLIDDIIASNDAKQQKILDKLFICARHFQISLIVSYQYIKKDFSPVQRDNVDVVFTFQQSNYDNKDALNKQYLSVSENKKDGMDLIDRYAVGFQTLVILNTTNNNNYEDFCYYYEADIINKKFKLGREYE